MSHLLEIRNLTVELPADSDRRYAVEGLSLQLNRGETVCVVGESGSGKSVTAHAVMQLLPKNALNISSGEILLEGVNLLELDAETMRQYRGSRLAMVFQEPMTALNPVMTVGDQVEETLLAHGQLDRTASRAKVIELLADMHLPDPQTLQHCYPFQLSGGQRQRVVIAMAMIMQPGLLIADEPTTALDVTTQAQILKLIDSLKRRLGIGVLFITHDFGVVADIADRVAVMQQGRLVEFGTRDEVLHNPQHPYTRQLIAAVPQLRVRNGLELTAAQRLSEPLLRIDRLTKTYKARRTGMFSKAERIKALDEVSLDIAAGETVGLLGESGSGKTTLGQCVVRLLETDSGSIDFSGQSIEKLRGAALHRLRPQIQMIFQDPYSSLNPRHKVGRIITENAILHGVTRAEANRRMLEVLELVGLDPSAVDRHPHEFSGGQRQRIGIARALVLQPQLIVADEPVSALDVSVQNQVLALLLDIRRKLGLSMLFITHDLRVASQICDRIAVMHKGKIVECNTAEEIYRSPRHAYTKTLIDAMPGRQWGE
ncbi:MAG TPA: ABC transporter ATP-binding protein, partial [Candidimonas sp.]|nr:ABC transporter ATP-binding protein [Candidimonas sp.]